jgi:hypothetical protein
MLARLNRRNDGQSLAQKLFIHSPLFNLKFWKNYEYFKQTDVETARATAVLSFILYWPRCSRWWWKSCLCLILYFKNIFLYKRRVNTYNVFSNSKIQNFSLTSILSQVWYPSFRISESTVWWSRFKLQSTIH